MAESVKFVHLIAGSTYITAKGGTIRFMGPKNGHGSYETSDAGEIEELRGVCKSPISQLREVAADVDEQAVQIQQDPAIAAAATDAAESAVKATTPEVVSAQETLAAKIAASKGK